ncbi:hydroxyacid dehydrogenase [Streptomyces sp. NPDC051567]|uniref:hydroxyacid dehydrogenase n=1 Tax=Streptomyces sp. NPDC051567 TaxID=3365660 RepID=UPI00379798AE
MPRTPYPPSAPGTPRTLLAMGAPVHRALLGTPALERLSRVADADTALLVTDYRTADPGLLAATELLFTHWGSPLLDEDALDRLPALKAVVHAAGSVKSHVTPAVWARGVTVSCAATANALAVAEFTLAAILFANKRVLETSRHYCRTRVAPDLLPGFAGHGNYRRTVGIVGASRTGRRVIELLRPFDLDVLLYDPYVGPQEAAALGVEPLPLDELVPRAHVVCVHAPELPGTRHMFDARRLGLLADGATLVNTARGSLVDTDALVAELESGRIHAVLDVTDPQPPPPGSPLYTLPNVLLTPHLAGSLGNELTRMAHWAVDEVERYAHGLPFAHGVDPGDLARSA